MNHTNKHLFDRNFSFTLNDFLRILTWIPFDTARRLYGKYTSMWGGVINHQNTPAGILPRPVIPDTAHQSLAFIIDNPDEILTAVVNPSTTKIACILCMNEFGGATPVDDTISVILVGIDDNNRPTSIKASEKWPIAFTVSQTANTVISRFLTTNGTPSAELTNAQNLLRNFETAWINLVADSQNPLPTRPNIVKERHPVAFILPKKRFEDLLDKSKSNFDKMVGFFGYTDTAHLTNPNIIAPFFVGLDALNQPVTDFIFTDIPNLHTYKYDTDRNDVSNYLLTLS